MDSTKPTSPAAGPRAWTALGLAFVALAALRFVVILARNDAYGVAKFYMADDAFYYFQTARNLAAGLGSTFDGVHATNGYHPLWFLVSAAAFAVLPGATAPLWALYMLQVVMLLTAAVLLWVLLRRHDRVVAAFTVALFVASWITRKTLFAGMESTLACALMAALVLLAARRRERFWMPPTRRQALDVFALLLALSLARLEAGLVAAGWIAIALWLDARHGARSRARILLVAVGLAVAGAAYLAVNVVLVGVPVPLSGLLKSGGGHAWSSAYPILLAHRDAFAGLIAPPGGSSIAQGLRAVAAFLLAAALAVWLTRLTRRDPWAAAGPLLLVGFTGAFVLVSAFVTHGVWAWYQWPALLAGALATFALFDLALAWVRPRALVLGAVAVVTATALVPDWVLTLREHPLADWSPMRGFVMDRTVRFIREQIPERERIAGVSNGIYAYFSGRRIENLEGLANGVEYFRARRTPEGYAKYLRDGRVRWIVFHAWSPEDRARRFRTYVPEGAIERVYDLDTFYGLDLRHTAFPADRPPAGALSEPNVYFVQLKP